MSASPGVVIVGAGQSGIETASALRLGGFVGAITLVGDEALAPYSRPPLSKGFLTGHLDEQQLQLRTPDQLSQHGIVVRTGRVVTEIDRGNRAAILDDGSRLGYDQLVLATGGSPRKLSSPDILNARNVLSLRTMSDAKALRDRLKPGARAVIIGGGYIGLEIAAAARAIGAIVTVIEAGPRVLARVTSPVVSEFFQRIHAEEGVEIVLDAQITQFTSGADGDIREVILSGGRTIGLDFILVGIGLVPRTELAEAAGLTTDNGIVVDEKGRTSDPDIFAVGDVARHPDPQNGGLRRLESAPNASEQGRCVAAAILGGLRPYDALPWFWSDQYDVKLQVAGLAQAYDAVIVRGDAAVGRRLTVLYIRDHVIVAADVVNKPADFAACKKLINQGARVDLDLLSDPQIPLLGCVAQAEPA